MDDFDPDEAADGDGLFGLPHGPDEAQVHVIPVPWEGTVSFGAGTAAAPAADAAGSEPEPGMEPGEGGGVEGVAQLAPAKRREGK